MVRHILNFSAKSMSYCRKCPTLYRSFCLLFLCFHRHSGFDRHKITSLLGRSAPGSDNLLEWKLQERGGRTVAGSAWAAPFRSRTHTCLLTIPTVLGFVKNKVRLHSSAVLGTKPDRCLPKGVRHPRHRGVRHADGCGGASLGAATFPASSNMIAGKREIRDTAMRSKCMVRQQTILVIGGSHGQCFLDRGLFSHPM